MIKHQIAYPAKNFAKSLQFNSLYFIYSFSDVQFHPMNNHNEVKWTKILFLQLTDTVMVTGTRLSCLGLYINY